ncbi:MAG: type II secretion system protein [Eubacterium sp.]|nr:type II secretion system protein [Eubacterium sp.]
MTGGGTIRDLRSHNEILNNTEKKIQKYLAGEREGFSLVELIIVIAIMAILIGVIALAVLPNIQRSRESKDIQALDSIASAANAAVATCKAVGGDTFTLGTTGTGVQNDTTTNTDGDWSQAKENAKIKRAIFATVAQGAGKTESDAASKTNNSYNNIVLQYNVTTKLIKVAYSEDADCDGVACQYLDGKFEVTNGASS